MNKYDGVTIQNLNLETLQKWSEEWAIKNFPNTKPYQPLLGMVEEIGELTHAHLKEEQGIRGKGGEHFLEKIDAIGDIIIFMAHYCVLNGIDLQGALYATWLDVKNRDWIKFPKNGRTE